MPEELNNLDTQVLMDMLAKHTADYTRLMTDGTKKEFDECTNTIALLQKEIKSRQQNSKNSADPDSDISSITAE
ncbi:MAG: hypothetical protein ABIN74_08950 [Ferruginibacter sp.]